MAVVVVEARRPRAADFLVLADALQAVGVRPRDRAVDHFIQHPRQTSWVQRADNHYSARFATTNSATQAVPLFPDGRMITATSVGMSNPTSRPLTI